MEHGGGAAAASDADSGAPAQVGLEPKDLYGLSFSKWAQWSPRSRGLAVSLFGVVFVSSDAVCVRWLIEAGVEPWSLLTWKMLSTATAAALFALTQAGGLAKCFRGIRAGGMHVAMGQSFQAAANVGWTLGLVHTTAARSILLSNLNPLWAAVLGAVFLVAIIFVPSLAPGVQAGNTALGDGIAAGTGVALAMYMTVVRLAARDVPKADMTSAAALGFYSALLVSFIAAKGKILPKSTGYDADRPNWQFFAVIFADGLCVGGVFICLSIAPRLCSAPEIGLVLLLESVLGPLWVFVSYGDVPNAYTLAGGGLLLAVLAAHEIAANRQLAERANDGKAGKAEPAPSSKRAGNEDEADGGVIFKFNALVGF